MARSPLRKSAPKYQQVLDLLQQEILAGKYPPGTRLPSEAALSQRFASSRITVGRAVRELRARGLVDRRAGSGTFVRATRAKGTGGLLFGLLIPDLGETEIFEPICQGMAGSPLASKHALLWGHVAPDAPSKEEGAWQLCQQYLERQVAGVFFAPLEMTAASADMNRRIIEALDAARIPVVLLDRDILPYPDRSRHDLVGIDNRRAGYVSTLHLWRACGRRRLAFLAYPEAAATVEARIAGYRGALFVMDAPADGALVWRIDPEKVEEVEQRMKFHRPDGIVCANDRVAGRLMHTLLGLGYRLPQEVGIVGIDDVEYASLLPIPLTTVRQPCREIGAAAMAVMLERVAQPTMLTRDILLDCRLVVRASGGSATVTAANRA
ncbi:MAG: GntR family transcriptional regulator [Verrucomicrobia bacterium]|nr:GntR family transcriptional regulator [Verrucomicrobiota bacterium]